MKCGFIPEQLGLKGQKEANQPRSECVKPIPYDRYASASKLFLVTL